MKKLLLLILLIPQIAFADRTFFSSYSLAPGATAQGDIILQGTNNSILDGVTSLPADVATVTGTAPTLLSVKNVSTDAANMGLMSIGAVTNAAELDFFKSRQTNGSADTIVNNSDDIGGLSFLGADGAAFRRAAVISAAVDGTPGSGDMPGRLVFSTTVDGASSATERFRIPNNGGLIGGGAALDADVASISGAAVGFGHVLDSDSGDHIALVNFGADASPVKMDFLKTRAASGSDANTIVAASDVIGQLTFIGADGASYRNAARIQAIVDATPGSSDMPGALEFYTVGDGGTTLGRALKLGNDKVAAFDGDMTGAGTIKSTRTSDLGWAVVDGTNNTACNSICTNAAVFGFALTGDTAFPIINFVNSNDATADICLCAGSS